MSDKKKKYLKRYRKTHKFHTRRIKWQYRVREFTGLVLARIDKPVTLEKLFPLIRSKFKRLRKFALSRMLNYNTDGWFLNLDDKWTFQPIWLLWRYSDLVKSGKMNDHLRARKVWFKNRNRPDEWLAFVKKWLKAEDDRKQMEKMVGMAERSRRAFNLFNAASQISQFRHSPKKSKQTPIGI